MYHPLHNCLRVSPVAPPQVSRTSENIPVLISPSSLRQLPVVSYSLSADIATAWYRHVPPEISRCTNNHPRAFNVEIGRVNAQRW